MPLNTGAKAQLVLMPNNAVVHTSREIHAYGHRGAATAVDARLNVSRQMALALSESQPWPFLPPQMASL